MSIPADIMAELANLQQQTAAAAPLNNAPRAIVIAMQLNADKLVADADAAQFTLAGVLDTWTAYVPGGKLPYPFGTIDPVQIINGVLQLTGNAQDEQAIVLMRGLLGRVADNLDQLP